MASLRTMGWALLLLVGCARPDAASSTSDPAQQTPGLDCASLAPCPETPCPTGLDCYALEACGGARCLDPDTVCDRVCGDPNCAIAESFPMQVQCPSLAAVAPPEAGGAPATDACAEAEAALGREIARISACETGDDCGQVLRGTSCGCTRDLVARKDADLAGFEADRERLASLGCAGGMVSTCDCPPAEGFACVEGRCTWNYR